MPFELAQMELVDEVSAVARSGVLWNVRFKSDATFGMAHGLPRNVPVLFFLRFISATLA